jgi:CYTH domain-containing protein
LFPRAYKKIEKIRYVIPFGKYKLHLDIFKGKLKGLIIAEVEFKNKKEMERFIPPKF